MLHETRLVLLATLLTPGAAWVLPRTATLRPRHLVTTASSVGGGSGGLRSEDFTGMAWDALQKMPTISEAAQQQAVDSEMLLKALLDQGDDAWTQP